MPDDNLKISETIGERFLRRELWTCDDCLREFELGAARFDRHDGIVCPSRACGSKRIGPKRAQPVQ